MTNSSYWAISMLVLVRAVLRDLGCLVRFTDSNDQQNFYIVLKQIYGPQSRILAPVRTADGSVLLNDKQGIQLDGRSTIVNS